MSVWVLPQIFELCWLHFASVMRGLYVRTYLGEIAICKTRAGVLYQIYKSRSNDSR